MREQLMNINEGFPVVYDGVDALQGLLLLSGQLLQRRNRLQRSLFVGEHVGGDTFSKGCICLSCVSARGGGDRW